jgi:ribulose-5-phosphate 4-epimerase/fuculose-1-phosphate aldolase
MSTSGRYTTGITVGADSQTRDAAALARPKARPGLFESAAASRKQRLFCAVRVIARRWRALLVYALCVGVALTTAALASSQQPSASAAQADLQVIEDLVKANHILAKEGVLDGFGHVSARSLKNPKHFYMSRSLAPALVTVQDIMEFDEDSRPVNQSDRQLYSERFIHGEILRARPDVMAVVHSHSPDVLPFTVTNAPLKALIHTASFLGSEPAPVFDNRAAPGDDLTMLVTDASRGAYLAKVLGARPVVLMRGHGLSVAGASVRQAVSRAIYTQLNARVETKALLLGTPNFLDAKEAEHGNPAADRLWEAWVAESER